MDLPSPTPAHPLRKKCHPYWATCSVSTVPSPLSACRSLALGQQYTSLASQPLLCGSIPGLVPKQLRFCRNYIEIMPSVAEGVKLGIQECQHQFRGRRWNCTTIDDSLAIFGPVLDKGTCLRLDGRWLGDWRWWEGSWDPAPFLPLWGNPESKFSLGG